MNFLKQPATVEMTVASGTLRVVVRPRPHLLLLLFEAALIAVFSGLSFRGTVPLPERLVTIAIVVGALAAWFEQLFGFSEVIEIDAKQLRICKERFGWERVREYPIEQCSELEVQNRSDNSNGLQCRLGWRTIEFGDHLSEEQAVEVLGVLDNALPEVAQKLFPSVDITKHFTKLDLS